MEPLQNNGSIGQMTHHKLEEIYRANHGSFPNWSQASRACTDLLRRQRDTYERERQWLYDRLGELEERLRKLESDS